MILDSGKASAFKIKCDYCGSELTRRKPDVIRSRKIIEKDSCGDKKCIIKKEKPVKVAVLRRCQWLSR